MLWLTLLTALASGIAIAAPAKATVLEIGDDGEVLVRRAEPIPGWQVLGVGTSNGSVPSSDASGLPVVPEATAVGLANIPQRLTPAVLAAAARYQISPWLIDAVARQESGYRTRAVSHAGAIGVMQLMPETARALRVDPYDPVANIDGGARYLRQQLDLFEGDIERALAAYNAGPNRVLRAGGIPRIEETRNYVRKILGRLAMGQAPVATPATAVLEVK